MTHGDSWEMKVSLQPSLALDRDKYFVKAGVGNAGEQERDFLKYLT